MKIKMEGAGGRGGLEGKREMKEDGDC